MMKHGSLFSGIGGFDLASEWMGWENVFHCEWNEFGKKVLHHYWPNAESFDDITKTDFTKYANQIDILTGGFPCQPYSSAGKRQGKEDERHLWPQMLRAIREISPRFVVGENVRGLTNWNGGMVFEEVCVELESYGYQVAPIIIPAVGVNAPHKRERIWFVAYSKHNRLEYPVHENSKREKNESQTKGRENSLSEWAKSTQANGIRPITSDTDTTRLHQQHIPTKSIESSTCSGLFNERGDFSGFPTQSPICGGDDGLPTELDGITFSKWRNESIKAYGNAIVPQVAYQIFKAIQQTI